MAKDYFCISIFSFLCDASGSEAVFITEICSERKKPITFLNAKWSFDHLKSINTTAVTQPLGVRVGEQPKEIL